MILFSYRYSYTPVPWKLSLAGSAPAVEHHERGAPKGRLSQVLYAPRALFTHLSMLILECCSAKVKRSVSRLRLGVDSSRVGARIQRGRILIAASVCTLHPGTI